jgi:hypothetical protein
MHSIHTDGEGASGTSDMIIHQHVGIQHPSVTPIQNIDIDENTSIYVFIHRLLK